MLETEPVEAVQQDEETDLIPPIDLCIRTKWKGARVDWNGTDPLL